MPDTEPLHKGLILEVWETPTLADLTPILESVTGYDATLIADLSLGAWRPHQLELEWTEAAGLCEDTTRGQDEARPAFQTPGLAFSSIAAMGVEAEAMGELIVREALRACRRLVHYLSDKCPHHLIVIVPIAAKWREEDLLFLEFVAQALQNTPHRVSLISISKNTPDDCLPFTLSWNRSRTTHTPLNGVGTLSLACLPGVLPASLAHTCDFNAGLQLPKGRFLVAPELRSAVFTTAMYDRLAPKLAEWPWLSAYGQFAGSNYHVKPSSLAYHAGKAFSAGSVELATDYLNRALQCAHGRTRLGLLCQIQGYRISTHRFGEAAKQSYPSSASGQAGAFLAMSRGWGYVLGGDHVAGLPHLEKAKTLLASEPNEHFNLYLSNILALAFAKANRLEEALALEHEIEKLNSGPARSWAMHYVNQINLGRLEVSRRNFSAADQHFTEAFGTQWGGRSVVDRIYSNVTRARLAETRGLPSRPFWMRAALHFATWDCPEALGLRHAGAVLLTNERPRSRLDLVGKVAAAFSTRLGYTGPSEESGVKSPALVSSDCLNSPEPQAVFIGDSWSLLTLRKKEKVRYLGQKMNGLRHALACEAMRVSTPPEWLSVQTLVVDSRQGREMAENRYEAMDVALHFGVNCLVERGSVFKLSSATLRQVTLGSTLEINPLVQEIVRIGDRFLVRYKRYRPPVTLTDPLGLISTAQARARVSTIPLAQTSQSVLSAELDRLEKHAVLLRVPPKDAGNLWGGNQWR